MNNLVINANNTFFKIACQIKNHSRNKLFKSVGNYIII